MSTAVKRKKTPREARTVREIIALQRDNVDTARAWILVDECGVCITTQRAGEAPSGQVKLTRRDFERFIDWYNTGKVSRRAPKSAVAR